MDNTLKAIETINACADIGENLVEMAINFKDLVKVIGVVLRDDGSCAVHIFTGIRTLAAALNCEITKQREEYNDSDGRAHSKDVLFFFHRGVKVFQYDK